MRSSLFYNNEFKDRKRNRNMRGLVIINAYPNGEKFYKQGNRIAEELQKQGVEAKVVKNGEVYAWINEKGDIGHSLTEKYDFAVYLDKDKYLGKMLELSGLRLFNNTAAIEICDDKMLTYLALAKQNIPIVETIPAPLCYTPTAIPNDVFLKNVARKLGFPMVVKKSYGSFGVGVQLVHGMPELQKTAQNFLREPHIFQRYIAQSSGRDVRAMVIGGKLAAAMERVAKEGEFRSNIELGGMGRKIELPQEYIQTAENVAKVLRLDYCGVDLLQTEKGPIVCEVNSNAFFEGLEQTTGENIAKIYATHIVQTIEKRHSS